jgi:hypothetical protein
VNARPTARGDLEGVVEPSLAQRFAEELVVDMVRHCIDVVGLLEVERSMIDALGGKPLDSTGHPTQIAMLAGALLDQAFQRVEDEWRDGRVVAAREDCVCCAVERQAADRRRTGGGSSS